MYWNVHRGTELLLSWLLVELVQNRDILRSRGPVIIRWLVTMRLAVYRINRLMGIVRRRLVRGLLVNRIVCWLILHLIGIKMASARWPIILTIMIFDNRRFLLILRALDIFSETATIIVSDGYIWSNWSIRFGTFRFIFIIIRLVVVFIICVFVIIVFAVIDSLHRSFYFICLSNTRLRLRFWQFLWDQRFCRFCRLRFLCDYRFWFW